MLIQCFENSTFRVIMNWSGPVTILFVIGGSVWVRNLAGRVGSEKMDISGLSVCLSVRMTNVETWELWQNNGKFCPHSYTIWKVIATSFLIRRIVDGACALLPEILGQSILFKHADFQSIFTRSSSAITPIKKARLSIIGSPLRMSLKQQRTLPLSSLSQGLRNAKWQFWVKRYISLEGSLLRSFVLRKLSATKL